VIDYQKILDELKIESALIWIEIRELRNKIAHEYASGDLRIIFKQVLDQTSNVLKLRDQLK
jgi:uncharacterized protein with HEPN domain